ncbi:MAG TPA: hypothetical protein VF252_06980, partial [Gemmatimonadales bacterium]
MLGLLTVSLWLRATAPERDQPARAVVRPNSMAILPFVNTSPDTADDYLGHGMAAELTRNLSRLAGLRVAPRSSAFGLKETDGDPRITGRRLNVGTVLQGTIRRSGDRLRVTAHLVDVDEGFDLWSETYERDAGEIFAVESEILRGIAGALRRPQPAPDGVPTPSLDAHVRYLQARRAAREAGPEPAARALALYQEAIALDSGFARAWSGLAESWLRLT